MKDKMQMVEARAQELQINQKKILAVLMDEWRLDWGGIADKVDLSAHQLKTDLAELVAKKLIAQASVSSPEGDNRPYEILPDVRAILDPIFPPRDSNASIKRQMVMAVYNEEDEEFASNFGRFDVRSIIHPAFSTDENLRIISWSKGTPSRLAPVFPDIESYLETAPFLIAEEGQDCLLGRIQMYPYNLNDDNLNKRCHALYAEGGIIEQLRDCGQVNQYLICAEYWESDKLVQLYIEISIVCRRHDVGLQSIMPIKNDVVRQSKDLQIQKQGWQTLRHDIKQPIHQVQQAREMLNLVLSDGFHSMDDAIATSKQILACLSSAEEQFDGFLNRFPELNDFEVKLVPLLPTLWQAVDDVEKQHIVNVPENGCRVTISPKKHHRPKHDHLVPNVHYLLYASFYNLLHNAVKAHYNHQRKHGWDQRRPPNISTQVEFHDSHMVTIHIVDNGPGVSAKDIERYNDRFQSMREATKADFGRHSGIILAMMAFRICDRAPHSYHLEPDSNERRSKVVFSETPGGGLTVSITVPFIVSAQTQADLLEESLEVTDNA